jgi:hypothetical protein
MVVNAGVCNMQVKNDSKVNGFLNGAKKFVKDYKTPLALTAGSLALWGIGANAEPYMTALKDPTVWRFTSYVPFAVAGAEAGKTFWQNAKGKELSGYEKLIAYTSGAVVASVMYEGWESVGSTDAIYNGLHNAFGRVIQQDFAYKGSINDAIITSLGALGIEGIKESAKKTKGYFSRK